MMSLWDALRMNMMISYQELVRTFLNCSFCEQNLFVMYQVDDVIKQSETRGIWSQKFSVVF